MTAMEAMSVERLAKLALFGELDHHDLKTLAARLHEVTAAAGDVLIEQGALPTEVFVLEEGTVEVLRDDALIAALGPGDVVGEIALVDPQRRTATVRAATDVRAVALRLADLEVMENEMPEIVRSLRETASKRLAELDIQ